MTVAAQIVTWPLMFIENLLQLVCDPLWLRHETNAASCLYYVRAECVLKEIFGKSRGNESLFSRRFGHISSLWRKKAGIIGLVK
jgi:hypothetical protein